MKAAINRIAGMTLAGMADSNHWITMDADQAVGDRLAAPDIPDDNAHHPDMKHKGDGGYIDQ